MRPIAGRRENSGRKSRAVPHESVTHLLDFYVDWCIQCQMQRECLERICAHHPGQFSLERVNIDTVPELARRHGVNEVPTLLVLRGNRTLGRVTGAQPPEQIETLLAQVLSMTTREGVRQ